MNEQQIAKLENDCRMVTVYIKCFECGGSGQVRRDVEWSIYQELITCPNCKGDTVTPMEVCAACSKTEDECRCLDVLEVEEVEQLENGWSEQMTIQNTLNSEGDKNDAYRNMEQRRNG